MSNGELIDECEQLAEDAAMFERRLKGSSGVLTATDAEELAGMIRRLATTLQSALSRDNL